MRALIQRVRSASVSVGAHETGRIGRGLLVYVGVASTDGDAEADFVADKIRYLRIFDDDAGKMNLDVAQAPGDVLLVSSFTLQADIRHGRRPAFTAAAPPEPARAAMDRLGARLRSLGLRVETGMFGEHMTIHSVADGPVNIVIESRLGP